MENFTFTDLVKAVAGRTGLTQGQAADVVQAVIDVQAQALAEGKRVKLNNFGSLERGLHAYNITALDGQRRSGYVPVIRFSATGRLRRVLRTGEPFGTAKRDPKSY